LFQASEVFRRAGGAPTLGGSAGGGLGIGWRRGHRRLGLAAALRAGGPGPRGRDGLCKRQAVWDALEARVEREVRICAAGRL
jgi:hypothetical protein